MSTEMRAAAIKFRRSGLCPIPLKHRSKEPSLTELAPYLKRPATAEELASWSWPGVGVVTGPLSGILVLDVDGPEGEAELKKHGHPLTPMVRTSGGGLHLYFKHPDKVVRPGIRVAPGLDVKAAGGYVAAPPSVGPSGRAYEWIVSPEEAELAEPPAWLMDLLERPRLKGPAGSIGEEIPAGRRNQELASLAGTMRRRGAGEEEIRAALEVANRKRCKPPLEGVEVAKIASSVAQYPSELAATLHISPNGSASTGANEKSLTFRTAKEIAEATPDAVDWYAPPWVAKGAITEIDGKIKAAGKTTFASHMAAAILDGRPFLGEPTRQTRVVWLTEQPPTSFRRVLERAGLTEREDLYVLHWHDTTGTEWPVVARAAIEKAMEVGAGILFVDTLGQFAGIRGDGENSAGSAQEAMKPLQEAAARALAVAFTRHERKGGGEVGESGRGSSAFGGAVDIILSIRRGDGNTRPTVRIIESLSRFDETPDKLVVELTDKGYRSLGDATAFAEREAQSAILDVLPAKEENAMKTDDLLDKLKEQDVKRTVAQTALAALINTGQVVRLGEGKRGSPYHYYKPENDSADLKGEVVAERNPHTEKDTGAKAHNVSAATSVPSGRKKSATSQEGVDLSVSDDEKLSAATSTYIAAERNGEGSSWENDPMRHYRRGGAP